MVVMVVVKVTTQERVMQEAKTVEMRRMVVMEIVMVLVKVRFEIA